MLLLVKYFSPCNEIYWFKSEQWLLLVFNMKMRKVNIYDLPARRFRQIQVRNGLLARGRVDKELAICYSVHK